MNNAYCVDPRAIEETLNTNAGGHDRHTYQRYRQPAYSRLLAQRLIPEQEEPNDHRRNGEDVAHCEPFLP